MCDSCFADLERDNAEFAKVAIRTARAGEERDGLRIRLFLFVREVERYLDKPGCNVPSRQAAMARLRWALMNSKKEPKVAAQIKPDG